MFVSDFFFIDKGTKSNRVVEYLYVRVYNLDRRKKRERKSSGTRR